MPGDLLVTQDAPLFDASQFKLQDDGTFRISIRGMAAMAGIDHRGLSRSLKSAGDENALPCARSLLLQGFCPGDVSAWSETGGIPEEAAPFILEHYAFAAAASSQQARAVLLAFSRVGINAYLKDKLGVTTEPAPALALAESDPLERTKTIISLVESSLDILDRLGGVDDRESMIYRDLVNNSLVRGTGNALLPPPVKMMTVSEALLACGAPPSKATAFATKLGKAVKAMYRRDHDGRDPKTHKQNVKGRTIDVADYEEPWMTGLFPQFKQWIKELMA